MTEIPEHLRARAAEAEQKRAEAGLPPLLPGRPKRIVSEPIPEFVDWNAWVKTNAPRAVVRHYAETGPARTTFDRASIGDGVISGEIRTEAEGRRIVSISLAQVIHIEWSTP